MLARGEFPVLLISTPERRREADRTIQRIVDELVVLGHRVEQSETVTDSLALVGSDPSFGCIVVDWGLGRHNEIAGAEAVITAVRARSAKVPIFIFLERGDLDALPLSVIQATQEYVFLFEDTPGFIAGRIEWSWRRYTDSLLPPFFQALIDFTDTYEYSMHTPGHAGGTAFRKSALLWGEPLSDRPVGVSGGAWFAARPLRQDRRVGAPGGPNLQRRLHLLRAQWNVDGEPDRRAQLYHSRRCRAGGPKLP
jgi:hypothetical protein